ncbi:hypothetical protein ABMB44_14620 [Levilactobacillus brevis]
MTIFLAALVCLGAITGGVVGGTVMTAPQQVQAAKKAKKTKKVKKAKKSKAKKTAKKTTKKKNQNIDVQFLGVNDIHGGRHESDV